MQRTYLTFANPESLAQDQNTSDKEEPPLTKIYSPLSLSSSDLSEEKLITSTDISELDEVTSSTHLSELDPAPEEDDALYLDRLETLLNQLPRTTRPVTSQILTEIKKNPVYLRQVISSILWLEGYNMTLTMPVIAAMTRHGQSIEPITRGLIKLLHTFSLTEDLVLIIVNARDLAPRICDIFLKLDEQHVILSSELIRIIAENAHHPNLEQIADAFVIIAKEDKPLHLTQVALNGILGSADPILFASALVTLHKRGIQMTDAFIVKLTEYSVYAEQNIPAILSCFDAGVSLTNPMIIKILAAKNNAKKIADLYIQQNEKNLAENKETAQSSHRRSSLPTMSYTHQLRMFHHKHSSAPDIVTEAKSEKLHFENRTKKLSFLFHKVVDNIKKAAHTTKKDEQHVYFKLRSSGH